MARVWSVSLVCLYLFQSCLASPAGHFRHVGEGRAQITSAPVRSAAHLNNLLPRQDECTFACAVCAAYAACSDCVSFSTPAGMECCTSKLADQSACPTANFPASETIFVYTLDTLTLYGNPTSLVIDNQTITAGATAATVSSHTLSIPLSASTGAVVEDGRNTTLGAPISTVVGTGPGSETSGSSTDTNTVPPPARSTYIIGGIPFTGDPTSLVAGTTTLTPGGPPLVTSDRTIAMPTSATGGQIQVDGTLTALPAPVTAIDSGTNPGTNTGPASNTASATGTITGSNTASRTSYIASNVPSGTPWGVMLTTVSDQPYTLTWVGSQINQPTTIIVTGPSTTETASQTAGGLIWIVPNLPPGFPDPVPPGPPPGVPSPVIGGGGIDPIVPGCIFGCGPPGDGGGAGAGFPCLIDCGGEDPSNPDPSNPDPSNPDPSNPDPSNPDPSNPDTNPDPTNTQNSQITSASSGNSQSFSSTSSSSSSSATGDSCNALCPDSGCTAPTGPAKSRRDQPLNVGGLALPVDYLRDDLAKRGLLSMPRAQTDDQMVRRGLIETSAGVDYNNNMDQFITEEITKPGKRPLILRHTGRFSSAIVIAFDSPPNEGEYYPSVSGLEGCTSVVIIGEKGCWISHFWQAQSFDQSDEVFRDTVIHAIEQGDDGNPNTQSPFAGNTGTRIPELADGEGDAPFRPQIYISTPSGADGGFLYDARVGEIEQALTGPNRAFAGITPVRRGYTIRRPPDARKAYGKVLIQYTNDQTNDMGERIVCPQTAIYRLWFEDEKMADHQWPAAGNQIVAATEAAAGNKIRKRQDVCGPSGSSSTITASAIDTIAGSMNNVGSTTIESTATGPITGEATTPSSATPTVTPPTCLHNPVNQDPPNCIEPSSSSQPFKCSAGSNIGVATYDPATWCGCNTNSGTLYPTMTTGSGDAACAYTTPPDTTVNPTAIPVDTASISSALTASVSSASADASWSSAAAIPSAGCYITGDNGLGDSIFQVYGINGWAGEDGSKLYDEENGCGILDPWSFYPDEQSEFEGRLRKTQTAYFGLGFFKGGCVERAIHSAGGPSPDEGPYEIQCEHHDATKMRRSRSRREAFNETIFDGDN